MYILSSENAFNLDQSKHLSFGKELMANVSSVKIFLILTSLNGGLEEVKS